MVLSQPAMVLTVILVCLGYSNHVAGHSMVLDDRTRTLYIFGGKMKETSHFDMYAYDIASKTTKQLFSDLQRDYGHEALFTVRGLIDPKLREIYV